MRVLGDSVKARYLEGLALAAPPTVAALADPETKWVEAIDGLPGGFPADGAQGDYNRASADVPGPNRPPARVGGQPPGPAPGPAPR